MKIEYNYHTHNFRCKHAGGTCEDYVKEAIKHEFKAIGLSDHGPYRDYEPGCRMDFSELSDYLDEAKTTREQYKKDIDILIGLEIEYLDSKRGYYEELLSSLGMEYLVLGQHFFENKAKAGQVNFVYEMTSSEDFFEYAKSIKRGMSTGLFSFVAHPDLIFIHDFKWDINCDKACDMIVDDAVKGGYLLEFNANGFRRGITSFTEGDRYQYPHMNLFKKVAEAGVPVIINSDCHGPSQVCDEFMDMAYAKVEELGLKVFSGKLPVK